MSQYSPMVIFCVFYLFSLQLFHFFLLSFRRNSIVRHLWANIFLLNGIQNTYERIDFFLFRLHTEKLYYCFQRSGRGAQLAHRLRVKILRILRLMLDKNKFSYST